jgi:hypothetical protein
MWRRRSQNVVEGLQRARPTMPSRASRRSGAYPGVKLWRYARTRPHEPDLRLEKPQLNGHIDTLRTIGASLWN